MKLLVILIIFSVLSTFSLYLLAQKKSERYEKGWAELKQIDGHTGEIVNSSKSDYNPIVSPDGSFLIFESQRDGSLGAYDLHLSFKVSDGKWKKLVHLGGDINIEDSEMSPSISPVSKYLFFARIDHNKLQNTAIFFG